jgi:hypothetical protein
MGWSNPQQFMVPPNSLQQKPPPEIEYAKAMVQIQKQEADAKTMLAQAKADEVKAKLGQGQQGQPPAQPTVSEQIKLAELQSRSQPTAAEQIKMADLQLRRQELQNKQQDSMMDAMNRKRDRESRERLAAVKLAEDLAANPQGVPIVQSIIPQDMLQRLESNEQPLTES